MKRMLLMLALLPLLAACAAQAAPTPEAPLTYDADALIAAGFVQVSFPEADPGIPAYARVARVVDQFYHADGWLAIPFFRDPDCVPDDFDLLGLFHFPGPDGPGAFGCALRHHGRYYVEAGSPEGTFPKLYVSEGDDVPFWFVPWDRFQAAMADGAVTMPQLRAMNPRRGTATTFHERVQPRLDEHVVVTDAVGVLEDGTPFQFHVTHVGDRTTAIRLLFR
jgi:hypothetical protein